MPFAAVQQMLSNQMLATAMCKHLVVRAWCGARTQFALPVLLLLYAQQRTRSAAHLHCVTVRCGVEVSTQQHRGRLKRSWTAATIAARRGWLLLLLQLHVPLLHALNLLQQLPHLHGPQQTQPAHQLSTCTQCNSRYAECLRVSHEAANNAWAVRRASRYCAAAAAAAAAPVMSHLVHSRLLVVGPSLGLEVCYGHHHMLVRLLVVQQGCHKALGCRIPVNGLEAVRCNRKTRSRQQHSSGVNTRCYCRPSGG